jgi:hypothetical protein
MGAEEQDQDPWHQEVRLTPRLVVVYGGHHLFDDRIAGEANVLVFQED